MLKESKISKEDFLKWVNKYCAPVSIYDFDGILSFGGSDGPKISDRGLKERKVILYDNLTEIDEYIKDGCMYSYGGPLEFPKLSWSEYVKQNNLL